MFWLYFIPYTIRDIPSMDNEVSDKSSIDINPFLVNKSSRLYAPFVPNL